MAAVRAPSRSCKPIRSRSSRRSVVPLRSERATSRPGQHRDVEPKPWNQPREDRHAMPLRGLRDLPTTCGPGMVASRCTRAFEPFEVTQAKREPKRARIRREVAKGDVGASEEGVDLALTKPIVGGHVQRAPTATHVFAAGFRSMSSGRIASSRHPLTRRIVHLHRARERAAGFA